MKTIGVSLIICMVPLAGLAQPSGPGSALSFDGSGGYVSIATTGSLTGTFTVELWANPNDPVGNNAAISSRFLSQEYAFDFGLRNANEIHGDIGDGSSWITINADAYFPYVTGVWHHVAYVVTPSIYSIYGDGLLVGFGVVGESGAVLYDSTHGLGIGGTVNPWNGLIDEVRIWNTARTAQDIQANMHRILTGTEPGLMGYWRFDEGSGTTTTDASPNGFTGTLVKGPMWVISTAPISNTVVSAEQTYDVAADFSASVNPNGPWSYAYSTTLGGPLTLYTNTLSESGLNLWLLNIASTDPNVHQNPTSGTITITSAQIGPGGFGLHPGPDGEYSVARFTSPSTGQYHLTGSFFGEDNGGGTPGVFTTTDVHVLTNGVSLLDGEVTGFGPGTGPSFDLQVTLSAGDQLDFAVGYGTDGNYGNDSTGLSAQILALTAPVILIQPSSQTVLSGGKVTLSVGANGAPPLSYQWLLNGTNVPGETNATLTLTNLSPAQSGLYGVLVTNNFGATLSSNALLTVSAPSLYTFITLAGVAGASGSADGSGSAAGFGGPYAVAVDSAGNLYVAEYDNYIIRKVSPEGVVATLAGLTGVSGSDDGPGNAARFGGCDPGFFGPGVCRGPAGVAADGAGNVYVADIFNTTVRKVTSTGVVTTLAGLAGSPGSADGTGSDARFGGAPGTVFFPYLPWGLAVDTPGNVFVADTYNHTIRKISPAGVVTTLAGLAGSPGTADGTGTAARFNWPTSVTVDSAGNVYVADYGNDTIRKVTSAGVVTTVAGLAGSFGIVDGTGSVARFQGPSGVAADSVGNVYVADTGNNTIRKVTPAGTVTTLAGLAGSYGAADGSGSAARLNWPNGVAADSLGNLYVADTGNNMIRKVTPAGVVTTVGRQTGGAGNTGGTEGAPRFNGPDGVALDSASNLYVADVFNNAIRKVTPAGVVTTLAGDPSILDQSGNPVGGSADGTGTAARFYQPNGVGVDSAGNVFVADTLNNTIRKVTPAGVVTTLAGLAGSSGSADGTGSAARFNGPYGEAVDSMGNIYVADWGNNAIRQVTPAGVVTTLAGLGNPGSADGTGRAAQFNGPNGVAVDISGNVYVADTDNNTIRKVTPAGVVTTLAGCATCPYGTVDGTGNAARFAGPWALAVDSSGNLYVTDYGDYTIRKVTPTGVVTTLAGLPGNVGSDDGTGTQARFGACFQQGFFGTTACAGPEGVAVDSAGNVYVADYANDTIRKGFAQNLPATIVTSGPSFGFNGGQFGFTLMGTAGQVVVVEASSDLLSWLPIWTNIFAGNLTFTDLRSSAVPWRFYRARTP